MATIRPKSHTPWASGDEMGPILTHLIQTYLLDGIVDPNWKVYDFSVTNRDKTGQQVVLDFCADLAQQGVGGKEPTITPNLQRVREFGLSSNFGSPNAILRKAIEGRLIARQVIMVSGIKPRLSTLTKPMLVLRLAVGGNYGAPGLLIPCKGTVRAQFTPEDGQGDFPVKSFEVPFSGPGAFGTMVNTDEEISTFAGLAAEYHQDLNPDGALWASAKDTITKPFDQHFRDCVLRMLSSLGLNADWYLWDDLLQAIPKSTGGQSLVVQNPNGDAVADLISSLYFGLAMQDSVLIGPKGKLFDPPGGTVTRHYRVFVDNGRDLSTVTTNPVSQVVAIGRALAERGRIDGDDNVIHAGDAIVGSIVEAINSGYLTKDLAILAGQQDFVSCAELLKQARNILVGKLS
jgi:isocitrate dehydrogenase